MINVAVLVMEKALPDSIFFAEHIFSAVNDFSESKGQPPCFNIQFVGLTEQVKLFEGLVTIYPELLITYKKVADLIIIPALSPTIGENINIALENNYEFNKWIVDQYNNGAKVASLCIGAFILASTGLLKGKYCSTHWLYANEFRKMFPDVQLVADKIITDQNGLYSSGGANLSWNLLLYLVEKYTNREMAILASKFFLLDFGRDNQTSFVIFEGQKDHADEDIIDVQEYIETHFNTKLSIDGLANKFGIGRRTFERRFKKATSNTVNDYIQRVKMEVAKKQIETSRKNIQEVMLDVGYNDINAFRDVFKKVVGISPVDYRKRYV